MSMDPNFVAQQQGYANVQAARRSATVGTTNNKWLWLIIPLAVILFVGGLWAMGVFRIGMSTAIIDGRVYRETEDRFSKIPVSGVKNAGKLEDMGSDGKLEGNYVIDWGYGDATAYINPDATRFAYVKLDGYSDYTKFKIPLLRYWFG